MPELPDVNAYVDALHSRLVAQTLQQVQLGNPFILRSVEPGVAALLGHRVVAVERLGKRIVIGLDGDFFMVIHLMIAGRLHWYPAEGRKQAPKTKAVAWQFSSGTLQLTEAGSKRRASLHLVAGRAALSSFDRGGLEVLTATPDQFAQVLRAENHTLKRSLTDPRFFSGIGNAYSDEILHRARLSPIAHSQKLTTDEVARLAQATKDVLNEWTTRLKQEAKGEFPEKVTAFRTDMAVHGRFRQPCPRCGSPVQRIVYATNETNYCPTCQTSGVILADRALSRLLKEDWPRSFEEQEELRTRHKQG